MSSKLLKLVGSPTTIINANVCEDGRMFVCYSFTQKLLNGFG